MQRDEPEWLSFQLAVEEVERRFGLTRNGAKYAVCDALENSKLKWRRGQDGPDVSYADLRRWLIGPTFNSSISISVGRPKSSWQQLRVIEHLKEMYPNGNLPRSKRLLAELGKRDPELKSLDWKTLRRAIERLRRDD
jgi:hypothetical protein